MVGMSKNYALVAKAVIREGEVLGSWFLVLRSSLSSAGEVIRDLGCFGFEQEGNGGNGVAGSGGDTRSWVFSSTRKLCGIGNGGRFFVLGASFVGRGDSR